MDKSDYLQKTITLLNDKRNLQVANEKFSAATINEINKLIDRFQQKAKTCWP